MKTLSKITFFVCIFMLAVSLQPAVAQSNIDMERMKRDINIMENILQELFKPEHPFHSVSFDDSDIRGTYLPGYGVIFMIPDRSNGLVVFTSDENGDTSSGYRFKYSTGTGSDKVTEESVINRISEFLRDYASTIGQLSGNDKITVVYNSKPEHQVFTVISDNGEEITNYDLPTISVTAQKSVLQAFRSGDISKEAFNERLKMSKTAADDEGPVDLKVMANIFETAFEGAGEKSFRINGSVNYLLLDTFGALFSFDAYYSENAGWGGITDIRINMEKVRIELEKVREELENVFSDNDEDSTDSDQSTESNESEEEQAQHKKEVLKAYQQFKQQLKQYLVDYGRTLSSVGENQQILVSVNLHSSVDEVPERIDLRLPKSVLAAMDQGDLSREEAMSKIQIREY